MFVFLSHLPTNPHKYTIVTTKNSRLAETLLLTIKQQNVVKLIYAFDK